MEYYKNAPNLFYCIIYSFIALYTLLWIRPSAVYHVGTYDQVTFIFLKKEHDT